MSIEDFASTVPELRPERFLTGNLEGWGVMESVIGALQKRYTEKASGRFDDASQILSFSETWTFDDGLTDTLDWTITRTADNRYSGSERHVVGEAVGECAGCAYHWFYTRDTTAKDGSVMRLDFDDWFYLIEENVCVVRGSAGRLGLPFAIAHVTYRRMT